MKISFSRSSLLGLFLAGVLLGTIPGAIRHAWETGDPYLLTARFFDDIAARFVGPGRLRFILQPLMAIFLGLRDGIKDAHELTPPFLSSLVFSRAHRKTMWRQAITSTSDRIAIAILLDLLAQALIFGEIRPGVALVLGPILIAVPYATARGVANRVTRSRARHAPATHAH